MSNKHVNFGFTLLELLISLFVFAIMSAMAYGGLNSMLNTRHIIELRTERLSALQKSFLIMERDIEQIVQRSVRDAFGNSINAIRAADYNDYKLEFTRAGWRNPFPSEKRVRSHLQRVGYTLKEERLVRAYWFDLDLDHDSPVFESTLLDKVKVFELRFVDKDLNWHYQWPPDELEEHVLRGIELSIEIQGVGRIKRLFRTVPGFPITPT